MAISVYVLVAIMKKRLGLDWSLYKILEILSVSIFEKTAILQLFVQLSHQLPEDDPRIQLRLFEL